MSFHLHESNDFSALAARLADLLRAGRPGDDAAGAADPFAEETVVVPNQGLARWLKLTLADLNGLCPALDLPYPGAFLYRYVFDPMAGRSATPPSDTGADADLPFAPATVEWRIHKLLARLEPDPGFERVRAFTANDPLRRHQLAGRLALLFDRYMTYRPDLLDAWEHGRNPATGEDAAWQARLWRNLIADNEAGGGTRHFSGLYRRFLDLADTRPPQLPNYPTLELPNFRTPELPNSPTLELPNFRTLELLLAPLLAKRRAFYFGVSSLPPAHLDVLFRLARIDGFDLHFFALNPCREEWSAAQSLKAQLRDHATLARAVGPQLALNYQSPANPLLGSLGRTGRDFFSLLLAYDDVAGDRLFRPPSPAVPPALATLQRGILDNLAPGPRQPFPPSDPSLTVHACHAPMREAEVLHDHLLALFRDLPGLAPRDISVYLPDVETYAPYIDAVFGRTRPGAPGHIPYAIADKSLLHSVDACQAFLSLLAVATGRFKASDVLALLQHAPVRERFGFAEHDLPRLGALLKAARLAWGLDAAFRQRQGAAPTYANTWRFALDRLLLGAAMQDPQGDAARPRPHPQAAAAPLALADGLCIPLPEADGSAALIGRLADFIAALAELHDLCTGEPARACAVWHARLGATLARFFAADANAPYGVLLLRQTLDQFKRITDHAGCAQLAVPFSVARAWLNAQLAGPPGNEHFVSGRVTFSRFQPMRNVPARVVCLLGMNDNAFPRNAPRLSFDLMDRRTGRRLGDRQPRDEDRYAFLEALLAVRERLVVTYTGQSEKDNKPLPPSVLVSELLDALDASFTFPPRDGAPQSAADALTVRHPLHPFSPDYFARAKRDPRLLAFSPTHYAVAQALSSLPPPPPLPLNAPPPAPPSSLTLADLVAFFRSPCEAFFTKRLGVFLDRRDDEPPDDEEPLEPDALATYQLKQDLLGALERDGSADAPDRLRIRWETEGRLPAGTTAPVAENASKIRDLIEKKDALHLGEPLGKRPLDIALDNGIRLQGSLDALRADGAAQLFMRPADEKPKDTVAAWLHHLAACAQGLAVTTHGVYTKPRAYYAPFLPVAPETARRILSRLTGIFADGMTRPLCFDPAIGRKLADGKELSDADWTGSPFLPGSGVDTYLRRSFGDTLPEPGTPARQTLAQIAHALFDDMPKPPKKQTSRKPVPPS